jgi:hypothetical protein
MSAPTSISNGSLIPYTLAPSSFGFLWQECRHCYYMQVVRGIYRPSTPFPSIFNRIDSAMKKRFTDDGWHCFGDNQPQFKIAFGEKMVRSAPIILPNRTIAITLRGKYDTILRFSDGSIVMCDFKTAPVKREHLEKYWVQLHAYAYAVEHPAQGSLAISKIDRLGLAVFDPADFSYDARQRAALSGALQWIDMPRDDARFMAFLDEVATVIESPEPPQQTTGCAFCEYRHAA